MEFSGFFTSCATPAVTRPRAASRSETCSWLPMRSRRFHVAQRDQRSHPFAMLADHLRAHADSLRTRRRHRKRHFLPFDRFDLIALDAQSVRERDGAPERSR